MNIKKLRLGVAALLATFGVLGVLGPTASAHYVYRVGNLYWSNEDCVEGYSEVSHGNGQGYSKSDVDSTRYYGPGSVACAEAFYRPPGYLRIRQTLMYWSNGWNTCRDTGNLYNGSTTQHLTVTRYHSSVCGARNYDTQSFLHMYNGSWKGGILWSGSHWLPI